MGNKRKVWDETGARAVDRAAVPASRAKRTKSWSVTQGAGALPCFTPRPGRVLGLHGAAPGCSPHLFPVEEQELQTEAVGSTLFLPVLLLSSPRLLLAPASLSFPSSAASGVVLGEREAGRAHPDQTTICICFRELGKLTGCKQLHKHTRVHQNHDQQRAKQA